MRAQLVVTGSRRALAERWSAGDWNALRDLLEDIAHDDRILAVGTCTPEGALIANTATYPAELSCAELGSKVRPPAVDDSAGCSPAPGGEGASRREGSH